MAAQFTQQIPIFERTVLQARNDRWHFPDEDDDGTKQDEIPHDQHSDAGSLENVTAWTFQLTHFATCVS
ncbi:hypothetical protein C6503_12570 [Candidatus Poribacteria bacterium]|nr:MAG: hypothetical protein C6503_12570 [Candidatus Poribacteria bacterium]